MSEELENIDQQNTAEETQPVQKPKKKLSVWRAVLNLISGNILAEESTLKHLPFLFYLAFLAFMYITNNYFAESTFIKIRKTTREVKEFRFEYISTTSELMQICKQSQIVERLRPYGVKESPVPPYKIYQPTKTEE